MDKFRRRKPWIRSRGRIALLSALMLGASVFLTGCEEDEYWDEAWYEEDAAEDHGEYIGYAEAAEIGESADSAADFGNGVVNGGRSMTMRSVRKGSGGTRYGSSGKLEGTIAVVTILADDATSEWNLSEDDDFRMYSTIYNDLRIGCGWIEEACAAYGRDVNFVWDWDAHGELIYQTSLDRSIGDNYYGAYNDMQEFIGANIDSEGIKSALGANGIVYMVCVDTPSSNTTASSTFSWEAGCPCEYEMSFMLMNYKGQINAPATFAHEILHTFGAPDLYYAGKHGITQEYVDYAKSAGTNDIMRVTWDLNTNYYVYDSVKNEITDITAYYLGLTDYSDTVQEWGLGQSDYARYGDAAGDVDAAGNNAVEDVIQDAVGSAAEDAIEDTTGNATEDVIEDVAGGVAEDITENATEQADGTTWDSDYNNDYETSSYGWWNMLDPGWEMSDWTYKDGEWYIYDEETGYFYIYMEEYEMFAALDEDDNLYFFDNETGEWVEE